jgi:hypothetical protein
MKVQLKKEQGNIKNTGLPKDVVLLFSLIIAFSLCFYGWRVLGGIIAFTTLVWYLICLGRAKRPFLLYCPNFKHWYFILAAAFIAMILGIRVSRYIPAIALGAMTYHYGCICIYERTVRISVGSLFSYNTIPKNTRPILFWIFTVLISLLGFFLLMLPFII